MSSNCSPGQLASTITCCLFCFFFIYRPSSNMLKMLPTKPPHLLGACLLACCCMSSQTLSLGSCAYNLVAGEKYEEEKDN